MFELLTGVYAEKIESGRYTIFTEDLRIRIFININGFIDQKLSAKFMRSIARQLSKLEKEDSIINFERVIFNGR